MAKVEPEDNGKEPDRIARLEAMVAKLTDAVAGRATEPSGRIMLPQAAEVNPDRLNLPAPPRRRQVPHEFQGTPWERLIAASVVAIEITFADNDPKYGFCVQMRTIRSDGADPTTRIGPKATYEQALKAALETLAETPMRGLRQRPDVNMEPQSAQSPEVVRRTEMWEAKIARGGA